MKNNSIFKSNYEGRRENPVFNLKIRGYNYIGISGLECSGPLHIVAFEEAKLAKLRSTNLRSDLRQCLMIWLLPHPLHSFEDAYKNCNILRKITMNGSPVLKDFPGL